MTRGKRPKPAQFSAFIPAAACTAKMRARFDQVAEKEGMSYAEVVREALTFFLAKDDRKSYTKNRKTADRDTE